MDLLLHTYPHSFFQSILSHPLPIQPTRNEFPFDNWSTKMKTKASFTKIEFIQHDNTINRALFYLLALIL